MTDESDYLWNPNAGTRPPDVVSLEKALLRYRYQVPAVVHRHDVSRLRRVRGPAVAAAALVIAGGLTLFLRPARWSVRAEGVVTVSDQAVDRKTRLRPGDLLVTGDGSSARVKVGSIGEVRVGPSSSIRLEAAELLENRFRLERGEMHARIWARPRVFEVATARARAIDLGCVYTLRVDENGDASIEVEYGAVEMVHDADTTLVPAGNAAGTDEAGRTVPWPVTSSPEFRQAATALSSGATDSASLAVLLAEPNERSTITLWHLLPRVDSTLRLVVARTIAAIVPPPTGLTVERAAALDPAALSAWEAVLEPHWSTESGGAFRRFLVRWRLVKPRAVLALPGAGS